MVGYKGRYVPLITMFDAYLDFYVKDLSTQGSGTTRDVHVVEITTRNTDLKYQIMNVLLLAGVMSNRSVGLTTGCLFIVQRL